MRQLFEVGEEVIVNLRHYPESNGEYIISEVMTKEQVKAEFKVFKLEQNIYYRLEGFEIIGPSTGIKCDCAAQSALRKKHTPGELSFKSLMTSLKSPVLEGK